MIFYMLQSKKFNFMFTLNDLNISGSIVIKLFESENELKFKNRLHDLIETLRFNSNF